MSDFSRRKPRDAATGLPLRQMSTFLDVVDYYDAWARDGDGEITDDIDFEYLALVLAHELYSALLPSQPAGRKAEWTRERRQALLADVEAIKTAEGLATDGKALEALVMNGRWGTTGNSTHIAAQVKTLRNRLAQARKQELSQQ